MIDQDSYVTRDEKQNAKLEREIVEFGFDLIQFH